MNPNLSALLSQHNLSEPQGARLLGVPVYTLRKWTQGQRTPSAAAARLIDVLGTLGALAPGVLDYFLTEARDAAPKRRGRPKKIET